MNSDVYLLRSETTGRYDLGWTTALARRLEAHQKRLMAGMGRTADRLRRCPVGGPNQVVG